MSPVTLCLFAWLWLSSASAVEPSVTVQAPRAAEQGSVEHYVALALDQSPEVRAAFERWRSATHRVARARTLPEPMIMFGAFLQSVETRVGPQQARLSLEQAFPWPTQLTAGGKAAEAEARASQALFEATALQVAQEVGLAYWSLWEVRVTRALHQEHLHLLMGLSEAVRTRIAVGGATLADLQQVDLSRARLEDAIGSMDAREVAEQARLRASLGDRQAHSLLTTSEPALARPALSALEGAVLRHPVMASLGHAAEASDARARAAGAHRLPGFLLGADWIVTGASVMPDVADSGRDAVAVRVGLRLPLWQGTYGHEVAAERAAAEAHRSEQRARGDRALAALEQVLARIQDTERKVRVVSDTLLPQAEAAHASVLGNYTIGHSAVAQTLLSQRDLLELSVERAEAAADHLRAWVQLDQLVGEPVDRTPVTEQENTP